MHTQTDRFSVKMPCGCSCGKEAHYNRLHLHKGIDGKNYHILDECRKPFEEELKAFVILKGFTERLGAVYFWQRWPYARSWFACQHIMRVRIKGVDEAVRRARRDTILFCLPFWIAALFSKFTRSRK